MSEFDCTRCGQKIYLDNGVVMDANLRMPHRDRCSTKPGFVWCPACQNIFSQKTPCTHYQDLKYQVGECEDFFINHIRAGTKYRKNFDPRQSGRSKSQYSGTTKNSVCGKCNSNLNKMTRLEQDEHLRKCAAQKTLF